MNMQLRSKAKDTNVQKAALLVFALIIVGLALAYLSGDTNPVNNQTEDPINELNATPYYDNETGVCRSPEINETNKSQLKACVSNQT